MRLAVTLVVLAVSAGTAWPCPASNEPEYRCTKYDYMFTPVAQVYIRDARGELPRRRINVMHHLTASGWHARADQAQAQQLQLFDAQDVPDTYEGIPGAVQTFVTDLAQVDHQWRVTIDGAWFRVMRCKEHGRMRTCLVRES